MLIINYFRKEQRGFSLIELLLVIVIIGILAGLAILNIAKIKETAYRAKSISNLKAMQVTLEMYYVSERGYPEKKNWQEELIANNYLTENIFEVPGKINDADKYDYDLDMTLGYKIQDTRHGLWLTPEGITNSEPLMIN